MDYREKHALTVSIVGALRARDMALEPEAWQRECLRVREMTRNVADAILDEALQIVYGPARGREL